MLMSIDIIWSAVQSAFNDSEVKMFLQFQVLLFTSVLVCLVTSNVDLPKVKTPLGGIKGYYKVSQYGRLYAAYEGVPYARPPVGKLRFEVT